MPSKTRRVMLVGIVALTLTLTLAPTSADAGALRVRLLELINRTRQHHDLHAWRLNARLSDDAKAHTRKVIRRGKLLDPTNLREVLRPYRWKLGADVVGCARTLRRIVYLWMHEPVHRDILLNPRLRRAGVGVIPTEGKTSCGRDAIWATSLMYG